MSPADLNPLVKSTKAAGNIMKKLIKQRPPRVSHLLQENMPKSKNFELCVVLFSFVVKYSYLFSSPFFVRLYI